MLTMKTESPVPVELAAAPVITTPPEAYNDNDRGMYVGLRRVDAGEPARYTVGPKGALVVTHPGTRPSSTDSGQFRGDNPHMEKAPEERLPGALKLLADQPGYVYLGSPYAKYHAGMDEAARIVTVCAGKLMATGMRIYCPIAHGHAVTRYQDLPRSWDYWKGQDQPLIDAAVGLIVLTMEGWRESVGLQYEIEEFVRAGKPILHVSPAWLAASEVGRAAS